MPHPLRLVGWGLLLLACRPSPSDRGPRTAPPSSAPGSERTSPQAQASDSTPPANVSHGEAPVGGANAAPAPVEAGLPPREHARLHRLRLEIKHVTVTVAPGVTYP